MRATFCTSAAERQFPVRAEIVWMTLQIEVGGVEGLAGASNAIALFRRIERGRQIGSQLFRERQAARIRAIDEGVGQALLIVDIGVGVQLQFCGVGEPQIEIAAQQLPLDIGAGDIAFAIRVQRVDAIAEGAAIAGPAGEFGVFGEQRVDRRSRGSSH